MIIEDLLPLLEYGIAAAALYMLYDISKNHLSAIEETLLEIKEILRTKL